MTPKPLQKLFDALKGEKKAVNLIVAAGILGMLLIAVSEWLPDTGTADAAAAPAAPADSAEYEAALETRLETLIRQVEGAGETRVMVTLAESSRTVYATDTETDADGAKREAHLLLDNGAEPPALVETTLPPQVQGVAVLCEGGGDAGVQARVTEIVNVLTGAGASHITVDRLTRQE
ncbi:MAG TPA: stage III sporulation protein AG [Candidatus Gemmiger faecigallinarum]|nr:stage III sporulation protein AG [Candidatus Gemmiger faecigallinarum]